MEPSDEEGWYRPVRRRNYSEAFLPAENITASNTIAQEILPRTVSPISEPDWEAMGLATDQDDDKEELYNKLSASSDSIRAKPNMDYSDEDEEKQEDFSETEKIVDILAEEYGTDRNAFAYTNSTLAYKDTRNSRENECFTITIDQSKKRIVLDDLKYGGYSKNCDKKGDELLRGLKKVSDQLNYDLYIGDDASYFYLQSEKKNEKINMPTYQILTSKKGDSYYNQQQFYGSTYLDDRIENAIVRVTPLKEQITPHELEGLTHPTSSLLQQEFAQKLNGNPFLTVEQVGKIVKTFIDKKRKDKDLLSNSDIRFTTTLLQILRPKFSYSSHALKYNPAIL